MNINQIVLSLVFVMAALFDRRDNRVPNTLCLSAGILAVLMIWYEKGWENIVPSLLMAAILFILFFPFWMFRIIGAGDVKLMMVSGLFLGRDVLCFLICAGVCTAFFSFFLMIWRRNLGRRMGVFLAHVRQCLMEQSILPYPFDKNTESGDGGIRVTYGMLAGHLAAWVLGLYGGF